MNATNGHVRLDGVRDALKLVKAQRALKRAERELKLLEHYSGFTGYAHGDLVDPFDAYRDADLQGYRLFGLTSRHDRDDGRNRPFVWSELDLDSIRSLARWLATKNTYGVGACETIQDYTIGTGFTFEASPEKGLEQDGVAVELARQAQRVLDEFSDLNQWPSRQREACLRQVRDGEAFVRSFDQGDGITIIRDVLPEQLFQPPGSGPDCLFGIRSHPRDVELPLDYFIGYHGAESAQSVPADEVSHLKANVDRCVKRGLSDFYPATAEFDETSKLLRAMRITAGVQAALAWIEEHEHGSPAALADKVAALRDQNRPRYTHPLTGREVDFQRVEPGQRKMLGPGVKFQSGPLANNTTQHVAVLQACLRALGARWRMTEAMFASDASASPYASLLIAGAPFVRRVECRQKVDYAPFFLRVVWIALGNAARAGRFVVAGRSYDFDELQQYIDIMATPPAVAISDKAAESAEDSADMTARVISPQERARRRGLDPEVMAQEIEEWDRRFGPQHSDPSTKPAEQLLGLQTAFYAGTLPRGAAIANATIVLGVSPEQAEQLFPDIAPVRLAPAPDAGPGGAGPGPFFPRVAR